MWLAQSALFVCPSEREGFGNVVVEALAAGVSVIATDCPGPVEILENGRFGTIVGFDEVVLAKTILSVLDRDCDKEALRRRAQDFTTERCINAYTALIDRPFRSPRNRS
jgi:glycosyltransferase involved in cell wall biosynthesis